MEDREHGKFECPNCHSGNIQQFELAYESSLSNLGLTTVGVGFGDDLGLGAGISGGSSQTMLSAKLEPPEQRAVVGPIVASLLVGGLVFFPAGRVPGLVFRRAAGAADLPWHSAALWRTAITCGIKRVWPKEMDEWYHSYICLRCGECFEIR
jgi:hypothetical protein